MKIEVIPDSSFFICFLDDIEKPEYVIKIFKYEKFTLVLGKGRCHLCEPCAGIGLRE